MKLSSFLKKNKAKRIYLLTVIPFIVLLIQPLSSRLIRYASAGMFVAVFVFSVVFFWKKRFVRYPLILLPAVFLLFLALPGRAVSPQTLSSSYISCLKYYRGSLYVWGGENKLGIDCSGLVRRSLANACLLRGIRDFNPALVRWYFYFVWHDCSAKALGDEYLGLTRHLFDAESVNSLVSDPRLCPGDIIVTAHGVHTMSYLGNNQWIEADPGFMRVVVVTIPDKTNKWFKIPVKVMRWRILEPEGAVKNATGGK